jgi:hypothetical protein
VSAAGHEEPVRLVGGEVVSRPGRSRGEAEPAEIQKLSDFVELLQR